MADEVVATHVEATVVSTNGKEQTNASTPPTANSEVLALFKADTALMVWLVFLAFGGGILALYYARVRYLPDIEWSAALIYLGVATIIGGGLGILFAMSLLLPGIIWSEFLIFDSKLNRHFCYDAANKELCIGTIFGYLGKPFAVVLLLSHFSLLVGQYNDSLKVVFVVYSVVSVVLLVVLYRRMRNRFHCLLRRRPSAEGRLAKGKGIEAKKKRRELARWNLKCVSWFLLSLVLSLISILTMYVLSKPKDLFDFIALTLICTLGVLISNHVVALRFHNHYKQAIVASLVAAGFLLLVADWFSPLSLRLMGYYGLGGDRKVELVVTEDANNLIQDLGLSECRARTLCGVEILSRLGDEYYVAIDGKTFTLPKKMVLSYQTLDSRPAK